MSATVDVAALQAALGAIARAWIAHADEFNALDAATGDGDMGVSMRIGAQAVLDGLARDGDGDAGAVVRAAGLAFNEAAGSTIGALIATAGMRAGTQLDGTREIALGALARALTAAADGIAQRGKSRVGDKTLLDALVPAAQALERAAQRDASLAAAGREALEAAEAGLQSTASLPGRVGRARWSGERGVDHVDAGATAVVVALRALVDGG